MPDVNSKSVASYLQCNPEAVHETSEGRGWQGLTVNLDYFDPFERDTLRYSEHHICINVGKDAARLTYIYEDGCRLKTLEKVIRPGEFLLTPAQQPVRWQLHDHATALSIRLDPEFLINIAESSMNMNPNRVEFLHRVAIRDSRILSLGSDLRNELRIGGFGDKLCAESAANQLAVHLLRHYSTCPSELVRRKEPRRDGVVRKVLANIEKQLRTGPSLLSLKSQAQEFGVSECQLSRWFQESEGLLFTKFVESRRIELAKQRLLDCPEKSIEQVAAELGFKSSGHFCKFFKRATGRTPTEFRNTIA